MKFLPLTLLLAACSAVPEQPRLQSYGAVNPICLILCTTSTTSADLEGGSQQNITSSTTATGGQRNDSNTTN